jgi:hypothetical protein
VRLAVLLAAVEKIKNVAYIEREKSAAIQPPKRLAVP